MNDLKEKYPELADYLINQSNNTTKSDELLQNSLKEWSLLSKISTTVIPSLVSRKLKTSNNYRNEKNSNNNFIYLNKTTQKFEGISMQTAFTTLQITPQRNFTITTTDYIISPILASSATNPVPLKRTTSIKTTSSDQTSSPLQLYHQFIYTVKLIYTSNVNDDLLDKVDIIDLLNEQNQFSSKIRVDLLKSIEDQLNIDKTQLRINWFEKLNKTEANVFANDISNEDEQEDELNKEDDEIDVSYDSEPQFVSDQTNNHQFDNINNNLNNINKLKPNLLSKNINSNRKVAFILISLSNTNLLEIQMNYSTSKTNELKAKYETQCQYFFQSLKKKHSEYASDKKKSSQKEKILKLDLFLNNNLNRTSFLSEKVKKVQFLKFCDLKQINSIFKGKNSQDRTHFNLKLLNNYIKNSTEEIEFADKNDKKEYELSIEDFNSKETLLVEDNEDNSNNKAFINNETKSYKTPGDEFSKVINLKSSLPMNTSHEYYDYFSNSTSNQTTVLEFNT